MNDNEQKDQGFEMELKMSHKELARSLRIDPFEARGGKALTWRNVNMTVTKKGGKEVEVLSDVWGEVPEKQVTAIMGPSGAGKTSLLNVLAGRLKSSGNVKVEADVRLNNHKVDPTNVEIRQQIAFVAQDDSLQITATPRECIKFSAKLRLPRFMKDDELDALTDSMLEELGLLKCCDTIVGGPLLKGISGGERKRTSVGVELVVKPALIYLDEPTSGLDSFSAVQIINVLKKVANAGSSVMFTIHQPSSDVFATFDQVLLMNDGRVMASGPAKSIPQYFERRGYSVPMHFNPADWIMNVAQTESVEDMETAGFFPLDERPENGIILEVPEHTNLNSLDSSKVVNISIESSKVSFSTQVSMLLKREAINIVRNKKATAARFMFTIMMSSLMGIIFWNIGARDLQYFPNLQSHFGALVMVLMLSMMGTAMPSLLAFPDERPVFLREYSTNHYSVSAYFVSRLVQESILTFAQIMVQALITFNFLGVTMNFFYYVAMIYVSGMAATAVAVCLGCSVTDPKMAMEFLPVLFVPQFLFAGFFVPTSYIPIWLRWVQYVCSLTYAVRLALNGEFSECAADDNKYNPNHCDTLMTSANVDQLPQWCYWVILVSLFLFFRTVALLILKKKALSFY